jgi:sulfur-oxidizing protein SoxA
MRAISIAVGLLFATSALSDPATAPKFAIDPSKGVTGDFSETYRYWRNAESVASHAAMANDEEQAWKLNNHTVAATGEDDLHPGVLAVDAGRDLVALWEKREPGFIKCLGAGKPLEGIATGYPRYDAALREVVTLERWVAHCAQKVLWQPFKQGSAQNTQITSYLRALSRGKPLAMELASEPMRAAYGRGETLFYKRIGQLNFACASCHTPGSVMGHRLRGEVPTTPFGDVTHFPTYRVAASEVEILHKRFMRCLKQMRAKPLPPGDPAYVDLEVFYTALSNGHPIQVPSIR